MASASCPEALLQASLGKTHFMRLTRLLNSGGTRVMRELFDSIVPPARLAIVLNSPLVLLVLQKKRRRGHLTKPQWDKLFPSPGTCVQSTSFDVTLLFNLLRENTISNLMPPTSTGSWDKLPNNGDISLPADMARIKYYRNIFCHVDENMEVTTLEFNDYWTQVRNALIRIILYYAPIGSSTVTDWETAIDNLRADPMTNEYIKELKEIIQLVNERPVVTKVISLRSVLKIGTVGAWLGGNIYVLNQLKDNPDMLVDFVKYSVFPTGILVCCFAFGSIKLLLHAKELDALEELWKRYKTGQLKKDLENFMISEELRALANGELIEFSVEIDEEEYIAARQHLDMKRETTEHTSLKTETKKITLYHYTTNQGANEIRRTKRINGSTEATPGTYRQHGMGVYFTSYAPEDKDRDTLVLNCFTSGGTRLRGNTLYEKIDSVVKITFREHEVKKINIRNRNVYLYEGSINLENYEGRYEIYKNPCNQETRSIFSI